VIVARAVVLELRRTVPPYADEVDIDDHDPAYLMAVDWSCTVLSDRDDPAIHAETFPTRSIPRTRYWYVRPDEPTVAREVVRTSAEMVVHVPSLIRRCTWYRPMPAPASVPDHESVSGIEPVLETAPVRKLVTGAVRLGAVVSETK
jgi:hypothetical protein